MKTKGLGQLASWERLCGPAERPEAETTLVLEHSGPDAADLNSRKPVSGVLTATRRKDTRGP